MLTPIRAYRIAKNISCSDLARRSGISLSALRRIERGVVEPSLKTLRALARELDVPIEYLTEASVKLDGLNQVPMKVHRTTIAKPRPRVIFKYGSISDNNEDQK